MSLVEHEKAVLLHRDFELFPKYPFMVSKLNYSYNKGRFDGEKMNRANLPGLIEVIYPGSFGCPDGYDWRYILWFSVEKLGDRYGSIYVAFPHLHDHERDDNVSLDRSIAVYLWGEVSQRTINRVLGNLMYALARS